MRRAALSSRAAAPVVGLRLVAIKNDDVRAEARFDGKPWEIADLVSLLREWQEIDPERLVDLRGADLTTPPEDVGAMTPAQLLALYDRSMSGDSITDADDAMARKIVLASAFAAQAYEYGHGGNEAHALCRSFLIALIDPTSEELDYLRADPAAGAVERGKHNARELRKA